jgi:hypothetical protein
MTSELLIYICELAVVSGILPVIFLYKGISMVGADKASIVATSELPITILMSFFVLGERMGLIQLAGIILIMCSIIILQYEEILERVFNALKEKGLPPNLLVEEAVKAACLNNLYVNYPIYIMNTKTDEVEVIHE